MKKINYISYIIFCFFSCSQHPNSQLGKSLTNIAYNEQNSDLIKLRNIKIDTALHFKKGCYGCETQGIPGNEYKDIDIAIYISNDSTFYINKLNSDVPIYKPQYYPLIDFYFKNKKHFEKQIDFYEKVKKSKKGNIIFLPPKPSHYFFESVEFNEKKNKIEFEVLREFEYTESGDPKYLRYVWKSKQKEWVDLILSYINNK